MGKVNVSDCDSNLGMAVVILPHTETQEVYLWWQCHCVSSEQHPLSAQLQ